MINIYSINQVTLLVFAQVKQKMHKYMEEKTPTDVPGGKTRAFKTQQLQT